MKVGLGFRNRLRGDLAPVGQELDLTHQALVGWREEEHNVDGGHTAITADSLDLNGRLTQAGPWRINDAFVISPPQIVANKDNYNPPGFADAEWVRLQTDASRTISGLVTDPRYNRNLWFTNVGNFDFQFLHNNTGSTTLYRIGCPMGATVTVSSGASVKFRYDIHAGNWRIIAAIGNVSGVSSTAPYDADYLVKTAHAGLTAERVVTDTASIVWDFGTAAQAKATRAALTGDVTASANSNATTIAADAVTNAQAANMAQTTIKGRAAAAGTGDPTDLTANQVSTILDTATDPFIRTSVAGGFTYGGDASDGALVFDGVINPVAGATLSGSTYTLTRDLFATSMTVDAGVIVFTNNFAIYGTGTLTVTGTIQNNGSTGTTGSSGLSSSGATGGATMPAAGTSTGHYARMATSTAGTNGGAGATGAGAQAGAPNAGNTSGSAIDDSGATGNTGSAGGKGGTGTSGAGGALRAGGSGGAVTLVAAARGHSVRAADNGNWWIPLTASTVAYSPPSGGVGGAPGGSGGGGDGVLAGGGGGGGGAEGGGGGFIGIFFTVITVSATGVISANGGTGGAGGNGRTQTSGDVGGGGGGAGGGGGRGGIIFLVYHTYTNAGSVTVSAGSAGNGGTKGSPHGAGTDNADNGVNGPVGSVGKIIQIQC